MDLSFINSQKVLQHLNMKTCIQLMESVFLDLEQGDAVNPLRSALWAPHRKGLLGMMPAYLAKENILGIKVLSVFPQNKVQKLPSHQGRIILFDGDTGRPLVSVDATSVTGVRTAAVSGLATRLLAKEDASHLAILGSGHQADTHLEAMLAVRSIQSVFIWSRNLQHAKDWVDRMQSKWPLEYQVCHSVEAACQRADIVCTLTASSTPILDLHMVQPGAHINAVGACTPRDRELGSSLVTEASVFVDRYESASNEAGDLLIPLKEGVFNLNRIRGNLGELLVGKQVGRQSMDEITLFESLGLAAEDLAAAYYVFRRMGG